MRVPTGWQRRAPYLAALLAIAAVVVVLHAPHLRAPFFADDYLFLEQVRGRSLPEALAAPDPLGNFLRPVGRAGYFWSVAAIAGEKPAAFRTVNLVLFVAALVLLAAIVRRLAGPGPAVCAAAYVALHYAADVPLLWISGAQDLLAIAFALAAILLHLRGNTALAALPLLLALLSKESSAGTAVIAAIAARAPGERFGVTLRRAWPLFAVTAVWAVARLAYGLRPGAGSGGVSFDGANVPAAFAQLGRVVFGWEFRQSGPAWRADAASIAIPLVLAALAVALVTFASRRAGVSRSGRTAAIVGAIWALLGTIPVIAVAPIWSAYFYLFALLGIGLVLGALVAASNRPAWLAPAALIVIGASLANARALDEFTLGPDRWSPHSHVNRYYLVRGMDTVARFLGDMRQARPTLPPRSTVFFAGLPSAVAFQTADGPLVRWAYADTSLRSYFLRDYTRELAARGPMFMFAVEDGRLVDVSDTPDLLMGIGYSMVLEEHLSGAEEALSGFLERHPHDPFTMYLLAFVRVARGDSTFGGRLLESLGLRHSATPPVDPGHEELLAVRDSAGAVARLQRAMSAHVFYGPLHGALAALLLQRPQSVSEGIVEAFAYRAIAPEDPAAWRLWAGAQLRLGHMEAATRSLDRYFALGGAEAAADAEAQRIRAELRRFQPGGDIVQESLRGGEPTRR